MAIEKKATTGQEKCHLDKADDVYVSLRSKLRDPVHRRKLFRWMWLPLGMLNLGIFDSQGGATLRDLQLITSTDEQMAALYITAYSLGYVLGSLLAGYAHGKINSNFLLTVCCVMAGGVNIATPYCSTFLLMFIVRCIVGFFLGAMLCIINAEHMHMWGSTGGSLLQCIHCVYAMGGVVGPAMSSTFITEMDRENTSAAHQLVTSDNFIYHNMTTNNYISQFVTCDNFTYDVMKLDNVINNNLTFDNFINLTLECYNHTEASKSNLQSYTHVHYAFLFSGLISVLAATPFLITLLAFNKSSSRVEEKGDSDIPDRKLPLLLKVFLVGLLFSYYLLYSSIEITFEYYLLIFIVKHFESVGTHEAAYIMTYYWALFATGRFLSIFTSKYISAEKLLYIHFSMIAVTMTGLMASAMWSRFDLLTVFACLVGLSFSATFATGFSWTQANLMKVNGPISAVICIAAATGPMVIPFVVGHLMEYVANMWFCYCLVLVFVLCVSVLAIMIVMNRFYIDRKYGKLGAVVVREKPQGLPDIVVQITYL